MHGDLLMKKRTHHLALLLAAGVLGAPLAAAFTPIPATAPAAAFALQGKHDEFLTEFKKAMAVNAREEMVKLVKSYPDEAVARIIFTCEQIVVQSSDEIEELIEALRKAWSSAYGTGFVDNQYRFFSFLDPAFKRERKLLRTKYDQALVRYAAAVTKKNQPEFELLANQLLGMAKSFETIGDRYYAAQTWYMYGNCYDSEQRGNKADLKKVAEGYGYALEHHEAIELVGRTTGLLKDRYNRLVAEGWVDLGEEALAADAGPAAPGSAATPAAAASAPLIVGMTFEVIDDFTTFERPSFTADGLYPMWSGLQFTAKGSSAKFSAMEDSPQVMRVGAADIRVDKNRDGNTEDEDKVPITGRFVPVEFTVGKGPEQRPWAFLCVTGLEKDTFQGIEMNLQPDDNQFRLYTISAASMIGTIGETQVRVIDDNMDGVYGSVPLLWAHQGLSDDMVQPEMDALVIGGSKRAIPWSEYTKVGEQWYKLESVKGGTEIVATSATVRTGTLKLSFKGGKPSWIVVRGSNKYENSYFDLAGEKSIEVPIGSYSLFYGELRKGKKRQMAKSVILPGSQTPNWVVAEGETAEVELGAPFGFDFRFTLSGSTLTVKGDSVVVVGKGHERYERPWNAVARPDVSWRKVGSKRGSKGEEMDIVMDNQSITDLGWDAAWTPLDMTLKVNAKEGVEVQLKEKKNSLFGKVESEWRGGS